jgi:hypothetical protein
LRFPGHCVRLEVGPKTARKSARRIRLCYDKGSGIMKVLEAVIGLVRETLAVVRAALVSWTVTARLCVILVVVAATTCTTALVLR